MATNFSGFLDGPVYRDFSSLTDPVNPPAEAQYAAGTTETDSDCEAGTTETDSDCEAGTTETDSDCLGTTETDSDCLGTTETNDGCEAGVQASAIAGSPVRGWQDPPRFH